LIINYGFSSLVNTGKAIESDLHTDIIGVIMLPDNDNNIVIGELRAYYLDVESAIENKIALWDVFDDAGRGHAGLTPYYEAIYDSDEEIAPKISEQIQGINLLVIDEIKLNPGFDTPQIRLTAVWETLKRFHHGCGLALLSPHLTNPGDLSPAEIEAVIEEQIRQYQRLGFRGPIGENVLYLDFDLVRPTPSEAGL